ncbi:hypothetical protein [Alishewanella phage vB_AspM_Slickus01]|nr:hypothetical protein [Alishewanella phage vB_AspM_Slicko01]WGH49734.1 hypothetical protein [Alishewanella phage vB_AspM_Slickus01]
MKKHNLTKDEKKASVERRKLRQNKKNLWS